MENINEIKNMLKQMLDEKRFAHTITVCDVAVMIAERFGVDKEKAYLTALLHDCARGLNGEQLMAYCEEHDIELDEYMKNDINPVHALVGADMAERHFGIKDKEILDAISRHAVGCEDMTLLDKIIFIADATEPNRTSKDADEARKAAETDLDKALAPGMRIKTYYLQGKPIHPNSVKMLKKYTDSAHKTSDISVREFAIEDLDECVDLYMKTYSKEPWNEGWESRDIVSDFILNHYMNNYFLGYVAVKAGKIAGVSLGFTKPWIKGLEYYIDEYFIDIDLHRQGVGSALISEIKNILISKDVRAIILATQRDYPAHRFYESMGFGVLEGTIFLAVEF